MPRKARRNPLISLWRLLTVWMCKAPRTRSPAERLILSRAMTSSSASLTLSALRAGRVLAEGRAGAIGGDQDRHLLAREAAFAGLAAAPARLAVQLPLALPALKHEGLVGLDDPGKPVRRLPDRLQEAVAPAMRRARSNPAARGRRAYRLPFGQRLAERQPALLVVQTRQRRAGERRMSSRRPCTDSGADRAPCPERQNRRCRSAHSAALRPRRVRSSPARPHPAAVPTAPPRPPRAAPPSDRPHAKTSPETARDPSA